MDRLHWSNGIIGLLTVITGFLIKAFYRPFAYENQLSDCGFANNSPSFFYVIGLSQLMLMKTYRHPWLVILTITAGSVFYEMMQSANNSLDTGDVFASLLGGGVSVIFWVLGKNKNKSI